MKDKNNISKKRGKAKRDANMEEENLVPRNNGDENSSIIICSASCLY